MRYTDIEIAEELKISRTTVCSLRNGTREVGYKSAKAAGKLMDQDWRSFKGLSGPQFIQKVVAFLKLRA